MKILVINSGSSSLKYQLFEMPEEQVICSGLIERIGQENAEIHHKANGEKLDEITNIPNHNVGLEKVVNLLLDDNIGVIQSTDEIEIVGHRVVHGGSNFSDTTIITDQVKSDIKDLFTLAPLHNPANYEGIVVAENIFPKAKQVAVFDTAFFQSMPEKAYRYAIPNELLEKNKIRVYGFHGTSHKYVSQKAYELKQGGFSKLITIHLGNGCSITAIKDGKSIDHSLGFGPAPGLIMGTRAGDIDFSVVNYLIESLGYTIQEVNTLLQKKSGMLGLTGYSDLRDIIREADNGNKACQIALAMNTYRIKKYIGSYISAMNGVEAIVFTAGIGENSDVIREMVCKDLDFFGIELDKEKNSTRGTLEIQSENSKVKLLVIPTNEELEIAKQSFELAK